ncbi:MAG: hypothetical protein OHK0012_02030 [Synechococcales cyanobacterium]
MTTPKAALLNRRQLLGMGAFSLGLWLGHDVSALPPVGIPIQLGSSQPHLEQLLLTAPFTLGSRFWPSGHWRLSRQGSRLRLVTTGEDHTLPLPTLLQGGIVQWDSASPRAYRGVIWLQAAGERGLRLINWVSLEEYVWGVVPAEMPPDWPAAALHAQAILARTRAYPYQQPIQPAPSQWLVDSTQDQRYGGLQAEHPATTQASRHTQGQILTAHQQPIATLFHSTCAGHTSANQAIFAPPARPYLQGVPCAWCRDSPFFAPYQVTLSVAQVQQVFGTTALSIAARDPWGRPTALNVGSQRWSGQRFWLHLGSRLGWGLLPGNRFDLHRTPAGFTFTATGAGHGVGLCQWGSRGMALAGQSLTSILSHYFPGSLVQRI